jgi:hypothetical protein
VGKKYASVSELVRDTAEAEVADEFDRYQADRRLVNCLTVMRCVSEVSQTALAERMKCAQSKVSKMESSFDADLSFGDIINYALALEQAVCITFTPARRSVANHIRFHIECIKHELDRLVRMAADNESIGQGIEAYAIEMVQKMVRLVEESLDGLPYSVHQSNAEVSIEVEGEHGQRLPLDGPKRAPRSRKKASPMA